MSSTRSLVPEVDPFREKSAFKRWMEKVGQLRAVSWFLMHGGSYRAHEATSQEKALLWAKANALYAGYDGYQTLAGDREIPVVVCSPQN